MEFRRTPTNLALKLLNFLFFQVFARDNWLLVWPKPPENSSEQASLVYFLMKIAPAPRLFCSFWWSTKVPWCHDPQPMVAFASSRLCIIHSPLPSSRTRQDAFVAFVGACEKDDGVEVTEEEIGPVFGDPNHGWCLLGGFWSKGGREPAGMFFSGACGDLSRLEIIWN